MVTLQEIADTGQMYGLILDALNVPRRTMDARDQVGEALSRTPCLLLLDNCEHLLLQDGGLADLARDLLAAVPTLTCLATSRVPLQIEAETDFRLTPLPLPDAAARLDSIGANPAVRLFLQQARLAGVRFEMDKHNAADTARLCSLLDGLPLGLSLMGGWAGVRAPAQVLADLHTLRSQPSPRSRRERHPTLQAAVQWSYDLLTEEHQFLLHCLAAFQGSWEIRAATHVAVAAWGSAQGGPIDASLALSDLCDRSLVEPEDGLHEEPRFRLLETVREFARKRLVASGEEQAARDAHACYFAAQAEASAGDLNGADQGAALARLRRETDNHRAALAWCLQDEGDTQTGLRLAFALNPFRDVVGMVREARRWFELALNRIPPEEALLRARVQSGLGVIAWRAGDYAAARIHHTQSLEACRRAGEERGGAHGLLNLALVAKSLGELRGSAADVRG